MTWPLLLLPLGFLAAASLVRALAPDAQGHGTEKVIEALQRTDRLLTRLPWPRPIVALAGGAVLAALASVGSTRYLGLGVATIEDALQGVGVRRLRVCWRAMQRVLERRWRRDVPPSET